MRQPALSLVSLPLPQAWRGDARSAYCAGLLTVTLCAESEAVLRHGDKLLLPLPPLSCPRQFLDAVHAWLQVEAARLNESSVRNTSAIHPPPRWSLSFAALEHGLSIAAHSRLRCHVRLIEGPLAGSLTALPAATLRQADPGRSTDLFVPPGKAVAPTDYARAPCTQ